MLQITSINNKHIGDADTRVRCAGAGVHTTRSGPTLVLNTKYLVVNFYSRISWTLQFGWAVLKLKARYQPDCVAGQPHSR